MPQSAPPFSRGVRPGKNDTGDSAIAQSRIVKVDYEAKRQVEQLEGFLKQRVHVGAESCGESETSIRRDGCAIAAKRRAMAHHPAALRTLRSFNAPGGGRSRSGGNGA
jgi:hypothetical protein